MKATGRTTVLLAEDNEVNQLYATALLDDLDCEVTIANNGEEALAHWQAGHFDVIVMDWHMPVLDGLQVTKRIRDEERRRKLVEAPVPAEHAHDVRRERRGDEEEDHPVPGVRPARRLCRGTRSNAWRARSDVGRTERGGTGTRRPRNAPAAA